MRCELELQKGDFHYTSNGRHRVPDPLPQKAEGKGLPWQIGSDQLAF